VPIYRLVRQGEGEGALGLGHGLRKVGVLCFFELAELGRYFLCLVGVLAVLGVGIWDLKKWLDPDLLEAVPVKAVDPDELAIIMMKRALDGVHVEYPSAWPVETRAAGLDILKVEALVLMVHRFKSSLDSFGVLNARPSDEEVLRRISRDGYISGNCVVAAKAAGALLTSLGYSCEVVYTKRHAFVRVVLPNWYIDVLNVDPKSGVLLPPFPRPLEQVAEENQRLILAESEVSASQPRPDVDREGAGRVIFPLRDYASSFRWLAAGAWFVVVLMPYRLTKDEAIAIGLFWLGLVGLLLEVWVFSFPMVRLVFAMFLLAGAAWLGVKGRDFRKPIIYKGSGPPPYPIWQPLVMYNYHRKST
jgi:hypothetical protein